MIPAAITRLGGLLDRDLAAEGLVIAEGRLVAERLLARHDFDPVAVIATPGATERLAGRLPSGWPLHIADEAELSAFAGFAFHRGILAIARRPAPDESGARPASLIERGLPPLLVLPSTRDPENLGALARSAAAFGFGAMLLGPACPDHLSRRTLRVSMGAVLDLRCLRLASREDWARYRAAGYSLVAATLDPTAVEIGAWVPPTGCAIALGDEYAGLDPAWLGICDERVRIAMAPGPDSLNVAAAGAVLMWKIASSRLR